MAKQRRRPVRRRDRKGGPTSGRRKPCPYCRDKVDQVDYKDISSLRRFISERGKIRSRRITGACRRHQSQVARAVKRARELALLPYVRRADGALHPAGLTHLDMAAELSALNGAADISEHDVVLAAPPAGDGRSYSAFTDHALLHVATIVAARTDELSAAANEHRGTAAIVPLGVEVHATEPVRLFAVAS